MKKNGEITNKRVHEAIKSFIKVNGYAPTLREIAPLAELRSISNVKYHLDILEEDGKIKQIPNISRGIILL